MKENRKKSFVGKNFSQTKYRNNKQPTFKPQRFSQDKGEEKETNHSTSKYNKKKEESKKNVNETKTSKKQEIKKKKIKTVEEIKKETQEFNSSNKLIFFNEAWWKEMKTEMSLNQVPESVEKKEGGLTLSEAENLAYSIWTQQLQLFAQKQKNKKGEDQNWLSVMLQKGTLTDRLASMTMIIQGSPVHSFNVLKMLITLSNKNQRREAGLSIETLKDLFIETLLPQRKLK